MRITTEHLSETRHALAERRATLEAQEKSAADAIAARDKSSAALRGLQASFDILAATFASDGELSEAQLNKLPAEAQQILNYSPQATPAK